MKIPGTLKKNVIDEWGSAGEAWLVTLPSLLEECGKLWELKPEPSGFALSYNYVTTVKLACGTPAVLKIGYPNEELSNEIKALRILNGHCTARLLQSDENRGAFLLEKIEPGTTLLSVQRQDDERSTRLAADLLKNFPVPVPADTRFPTVMEWAEVFQRVKKLDWNPLPLAILDKASSLLKELARDKTEEALLHGDLHHENILFDDNRGWLSIDPKGVIGDPLFNAARFLNNPRSELVELPLEKIVERRLEIFAFEFKADKAKLAAWAYIDCLLSASWWIESGGTTASYSLGCAEVLENFLSV